MRAVLAGVLGLVLLGASGCGLRTVEYQADYPSYDSVDVLFERADLVVRAAIGAPGRVEELHIGGPPSDTMVYTVFDVQVSRVYKGSAATGQQVSVKQLGGTFDGVDYRAGETVYLAPGTTYLLFLETYPDSPASLLNPWQGQYVLDASGVPVALPGNTLRVSVADLDRLGQVG